jgi:hypothetical protein
MTNCIGKKELALRPIFIMHIKVVPLSLSFKKSMAERVKKVMIFTITNLMKIIYIKNKLLAESDTFL